MTVGKVSFKIVCPDKNQFLLNLRLEPRSKAVKSTYIHTGCTTILARQISSYFMNKMIG